MQPIVFCFYREVISALIMLAIAWHSDGSAALSHLCAGEHRESNMLLATRLLVQPHSSLWQDPGARHEGCAAHRAARVMYLPVHIRVRCCCCVCTWSAAALNRASVPAPL